MALTLRRQVAVTEYLPVAIFPIGIGLGSVDDLRRVVVRLELTALDVLHPSVVDDFLHADALVGVGIKHL